MESPPAKRPQLRTRIACHLALAQLSALVVLILPAAPAQAQTLVLNSAAAAPRSLPDGTGFLDRIVQEAFRRIGVKVRIVALPAARGLPAADKGETDGECWRIPGHEAAYPNLVMVKEPIDEASVSVFTKRDDVAVAGWMDLKPYNVAYISGWKILEANVGETRSLVTVQNIDALFGLLASDRADLVLTDPVMGVQAVRQLGLSGIRMLPHTLARVQMYAYLNRRHAALAPRLAEALRAMKRDGTFLRLAHAGAAEALL